MIFLLAVFIIALILLLPPVINRRNKKITQIINDLIKLKSKKGINLYAVNENIRFYRFARTIPGYIFWVIFIYRTIDKERILELADLPLPKWEEELYSELTIIESKKFPGLSTPLINLIIDQVNKRDNFVIFDLGCGGMEVIRQVIEKSQLLLSSKNITFVGIDRSAKAWPSIEENFKSLKVKVQKIDSFNYRQANKGTAVYFMQEDALNVCNLKMRDDDIIFHSRFRHHLNTKEKKRLDDLCLVSNSLTIEYDDYTSAFCWFPLLITAWNKPALLNGAVLSHIRQPTKRELKRLKEEGANVIFFSPPGSYVKI